MTDFVFAARRDFENEIGFLDMRVTAHYSETDIYSAKSPVSLYNIENWACAGADERGQFGFPAIVAQPQQKFT